MSRRSYPGDQSQIATDLFVARYYIREFSGYGLCLTSLSLSRPNQFFLVESLFVASRLHCVLGLGVLPRLLVRFTHELSQT